VGVGEAVRRVEHGPDLVTHIRGAAGEATIGCVLVANGLAALERRKLCGTQLTIANVSQGGVVVAVDVSLSVNVGDLTLTVFAHVTEEGCVSGADRGHLRASLGWELKRCTSDGWNMGPRDVRSGASSASLGNGAVECVLQQITL
jgi:hypothetical protein